MRALRQLLTAPKRWVPVAALAVLAVLSAGYWSAQQYARSRLQRAVEALGGTGEVRSVRMGFGRVQFRDVTVKFLDAARLELPHVEVNLGVFAPTSVRAHGGTLRVDGSLSELQAKLQARRPQATTSDETPTAKRELEVHGLTVVWRSGAAREQSLIAWGVRVVRTTSDELELSTDLLRFHGGNASTEVRGLEASVQRLGKRRLVRRIEAARARVQLGFDESVPVAREDAPRSQSQAADRLRPALGMLGAATSDGFRANVVSVDTEIRRGGEELRFGPSRLAIERRNRVVALELTPHPTQTAGNTPLLLRARLPLDAAEGDAELDVTGGPISLAALGVREGDFGLVGVLDARLDVQARVTAKLSEQRFELTSQGHLENVRLRREALAPREISGVRLGWRVDGALALTQHELLLRDAELSIGDVRAVLSGSVAQTQKRTRVALRAETPLSACSALLSAVPRGMAPQLEGIRMDGTFAVKGQLDFDTDTPSATKVKLDVDNHCRVREVPPIVSPRRFRMPWRREVKGADGLPMEVESGPGTANWTNYEDISPHLETAIVVCEDAGFFHHRGFDYSAIQNSIRMNIEAGRFLRGGSTVSMQLAKNLYLSREKNLARKLQEAVFTMLLEQELSKHELLELYLNVIEFGPGIYGIRDAARYYFDEEPRELSLGQALYLGSILPNPDALHFQADGRISAGWGRYLQKLMHIARKVRRISDEELQTGLAEEIAFRRRAAPAALATPDVIDETPPEVP